MDKVKFLKNFIFLQGFAIFIIHFLLSPYPLNSIKRFKYSFNLSLEEYMNLRKISREKIVIDENGYDIKIISSGEKIVKPWDVFFFFKIGNYKFEEYKNGVWIIQVKEKEPSNIEVNLFNLEKEEEKLIHYLKEKLKGNCVLFVSFNSFYAEKGKGDEVFKQMGAKRFLEAKRGNSYIFVVRKKGREFIPLYEKISEDKILLLELKIKI